ncbi:MAG: lamin tail domain-containing protein, partial [Alistipes sp.]|nr:lamin tail domain-containing protein [Alistipes sp.]
MKKIFLALAVLVAAVSCVKDESQYFRITDVKGVVINEVYTFSNQSEVDDLDWIELYNPTDQDIDLEGVLMWESGGSEEAWAFPKGSIIKAKGYFVVDSDKYGLLNDPLHHPAWGLSKGPDEFMVL